jgi:predicted lipid-binding transport protein (Tim44 family)
MDEFLDLPTIIVIGIAIVILFRLRSVLGTRTGQERPPVDRTRRPEAPTRREPGEDNVTPIRPRTVEAPDLDDERRTRKVAAEIEQFGSASPEVAAGLKAISEADPTFTPKSFLDGAKQAYEMIVTAFAEGDRKTLKNLLEKDVYDGFEAAIADREAKGYKVDFTFVGLPKIEISGAEYDKRTASITIRFRAEVVSATRDKDGALIEGNADQVVTIADEWTFARNPKSRDPNWKLVATSQIE